MEIGWHDGRNGARQRHSFRKFGLGALGRFVVTSPGGNTITFEGSVEVTLAGGGNNDAAAWACTVTISGEPDFAGPEELSS